MAWRLLLAAVALVVVGCSQRMTTNRIYSNRILATEALPVGQPLAVGIEQLIQAPEAYEGTFVRVTAEYRRAPVVVCDGLTRHPPASWRLAQGEQTVAAGGFEALVSELLPSGLTVTVNGVWRFWRGPVGCGKSAPLQSIWYLAVTDIVQPNPVARVTLTPPGGGPAEPTDAFDDMTETPAGPPPLGTPASEPTLTLEATEAPEATRPAATPRPTSTAPASPTAEDDDVTSIATEPATETPDGTASPAGTASPGATGTAGGGQTATPTVTSPAATATPGGAVVDRGEVEFQDLVGGRMAEDETDSWQFEVAAGDVITISVATDAASDIVLTVLDPAGNRVVQQNSGGAGQSERVEALEAQGSGGYRVVVSEASANEADYLLLILNSNDENYYPFIFAGLLSYGSTASANMAAATDQFWFFSGNSQEVVNINVAPSDGTDLFIDLFDPEGEVLEELIDEAGAGGSEQIINYVLPATGLYGIRVGEVEYEPSSFTILVSRN